jgi:sucrose-6-phosphate hydrolase SacC (GH32 family)
MALYLDGDEYALLASPDLRRWRLLQRLRLEGARECPDLFEVGDRWVFWGANGRYLLGDFDGSRFEPSSGPHTFSYGTAYAAQTWSGAPRDRVVQIAWLKGDKPGEPFNQQMTLPCSLSLRDTAEGPRLASEPVPELSSLAAGRGRLEAGRIEAGAPPARLRAGELLDVTLEARLEGDAALEIHLRGLTVGCGGGEMACCGHRGPLALEGQTLRLRAVVDRSSLELFAGGGLSNMPLPLVPETGNREVSLRVTRGCLAGVRLRVVTLRSAWP